jgi:hypothetical protein
MQHIGARKIVIGATLLAGILAALLITQQKALDAARVEQMRLQAQLRDLSTASRLAPGMFDGSERDRADLERLRREATELRSRIAELLAQARQLVTASPWHKPGGVYLDEVLRLGDAGDAGQGTPVAAMQTLIWALTHGDTNRFAQLMAIEAGADVQRVQQKMLKEVQRVSVDFTWDTNMQKSEFLLLEEQPAENGDQWIVTAKNGPSDLAAMVRDIEGLEDFIMPDPGQTGRMLLRPTDTGWQFVITTNGFLMRDPFRY